jgi:hypothetical protein
VAVGAGSDGGHDGVPCSTGISIRCDGLTLRVYPPMIQ